MEHVYNKATKGETQAVSTSLGEKTIQSKARVLQDNRPATMLQRKVNSTVPNNRLQARSNHALLSVNQSAAAPLQLISNNNNVVQRIEIKDTLIRIGSYLGIKPGKEPIAAYFGITVAMLTSYLTPFIGVSALIAVAGLRTYARFYRKELYEAAVAKNLAYKTRVQGIVTAAKNQKKDLRLKNSAEWLATTSIEILSATGDSTERVKAANKDPRTHQALFGSGLNSGAAEYKWEDLQDPEVHIQQKGQLGSQELNKMTLVMSDGLPDESIRRIIKHEVQHDADEHKEETGDGALIGYQTEYRAYSYEGGPFDKFSNKKKEEHEGYHWTQKQYKIFEHIRKHYPYVEQAWNQPDKQKQAVFRRGVFSYKDPDAKGVNKNNSTRIGNFWLLLKLLTPGLTDTRDEYYRQMIQQSFFIDALKLTRDDAQYILGEGKTIMSKIKEIMPEDGKAYKVLMRKLREVK